MPYKDPEKAKEYKKEYQLKNKQKIAEYQKEFRQTPNGKKTYKIGKWKHRGLIHDNYNELYDNYLNTNKCDVCKYVFDKSNWRCLDHDHDTGLFRQILCHKCNIYDNWKKINLL